MMNYYNKIISLSGRKYSIFNNDKCIIYTKKCLEEYIHTVNVDLVGKGIKFNYIGLSKNNNYYFNCLNYFTFCPFCYLKEKLSRLYYQFKSNIIKLYLKNINDFTNYYYFCLNIKKKKIEIFKTSSLGIYSSDYLIFLNNKIFELMPKHKLYDKIEKIFTNFEDKLELNLDKNLLKKEINFLCQNILVKLLSTIKEKK